VSKERDLATLSDFLEKHQMGVDQLFYLIHLGARQLALSGELPEPTRAHWKKVAEECHDLWHNTTATGKRLI
jgi:hypothetical protein